MKFVRLLFALAFFTLPAQAQYGGGMGEPNDPYLIYTAEQMNAIGANPDWDIDLVAYTGTDFNIIGNQAIPFTGVFDGNAGALYNYRASGALFERVTGPNAQVKNLGLVKPDGYHTWNGSLLIHELEEGTVSNCHVQDCNLSCKWPGDGVGGLVFSNNGTIIDCHISGQIEGGHNVGGGLVAYNLAGGTIISCSSSTSVRGHHAAGALVGSNEGGIRFCYSVGPVSGLQAGGLVGDNTGVVSNCYCTGNVGGSGAGGLVGWNGGIVSKCYSTGSVSGTGPRRAGGLVGAGRLQGVTASFWDTQTSGQAAGAGGTGKTTAEMKNAGTFLAAGWDFNDLWDIAENQTYPFLRRHPTGDLNYDYRVDLLDVVILAEHWLEGVE
jgi:hypothetical protein